MLNVTRMRPELASAKPGISCGPSVHRRLDTMPTLRTATLLTHAHAAGAVTADWVYGEVFETRQFLSSH
ncbi:MAG: hypothetical protein KDB23_19005 [Planctomycetales bacterium]|nr:hypothetical protein [Planctomycetales bacterium]